MKGIAFLKLTLSMIIFGTIGFFVTSIDAGRGFIAMIRGVFGALFIVLFLLILRKRPSAFAIRKNLLYLFLSGFAIGINWILLFESYSYTTIAAATLCYYMAPVFVIIASFLFFRTKISLKKGICVLCAVFGMILISGILEGNGGGKNQLIGVLLALGAAVFYATVTMLNKKLSDISSYDRTIVQLFFAGITLVPYVFIVERDFLNVSSGKTWLSLLVIVILHTGLAYLLFFSSLKELSADTVAVFSYLDPIVAMIMSLIVLKEEMSTPSVIGAVIIIISAFFAEVDLKNIIKQRKSTNKE